MTGRAIRGHDGLRQKLQAIWPESVQWDCSLAPYTTLRVGGPAAALIEPSSLAELELLLQGLGAQGLPWLVIGRGSNILVADEGFAGVVVVLGSRLATIEEIREQDHCLVRAAGGCSLPRLVSWCTDRGLSGLEFAAGIPGSIGGAIVMNAGAWGEEISAVLDSFLVVTGGGERLQLQAAEEIFEYRRWRGRADVVVASGTFRLVPEDPIAINERCRHFLQMRRERQPLGEASAGSFFKNPPGQAAGRLIEEAGLKGMRIGGARISEFHANFLVNEGGATARDFVELMNLVQERVRRATGISLEPEVQLLGFQENKGRS
jgi:UDP-N-acetylmuramate dehydrogenase